MASYRAEIQIGVVGIGQLGTLQKSLNQVSKTVDLLNTKKIEQGFNVQNINTYNTQLQKAWQNINKAALGSQEELKAVQDLVTAKRNQVAVQERLNKLIKEQEIAQQRIIATRDAGVGVQGPRLPAGFTEQGRKPAGGGLAFNPAATAENLALGAGFPLLFGGGAGQVAGGLIGSFFGQGFGGQILGSAIGQQLEDAITRVNDIGKATKTLNLDTLRDSVVAVNADLDITVERLIKAGQADAARAEISRQVALQTGLLPEATSATEQAVSALNTAWNEVVGAVSGLLSLLGRPFVSAFAVILQGIAKAVQGMNILIQLMNKYIPGIAIANRLWAEIEKRLPKIAENQEQLRAEIERQTDAYSKQISRSLKLEEIDKRRNIGTTAEAKIQNNELDRQAKIEELRGKTQDKIAEARLKFRGQDISLLEKQILAEAAIEERAINREAARQRERLELEKALGVIKATLIAEESRIRIQSAYREQTVSLVQSELQLSKELVDVEVSRLQSQQKYALSLNETSALIDKQAASKIELAQIDEQNASLQAENSVSIAAAEKERASAAAFAAKQEWEKLGRAYSLTDEKKAELQAIIDQEPVAARNLEVTKLTAEQTKIAAAARLDHTTYTVDLERREQQVAAYAAELARESQRAALAAQEQLASLNNNLNVTQSINQANITINNAAADLLRIKLQQTTTEEERKAILLKLRDIEIENARLTYESTIAQIDAEIKRQQIAYNTALSKVQEYKAVVKLAEAQGVVTQNHYEALDAQLSSLRIVEDTLRATKTVADAQKKAALATYESSVAQAQANHQTQLLTAGTQQAAAAAGQYAVNMQNAAGAVAQAANNIRTLEDVQAEINTLGRTSTQVATYTDEEMRQQGIGPYANAATRAAHQAKLYQERLSAESEDGTTGTRLSSAMGRYASGQQTDLSPSDSVGFSQSETADLMGTTGRYSGGSAATRGSTYRRTTITPPKGKDPASINPMINVTTGPVINMDGKTYVSQSDFVAGMENASRRGAQMALEALGASGSTRRGVGLG